MTTTTAIVIGSAESKSTTEQKRSELYHPDPLTKACETSAVSSVIASSSHPNKPPTVWTWKELHHSKVCTTAAWFGNGREPAYESVGEEHECPNESIVPPKCYIACLGNAQTSMRTLEVYAPLTKGCETLIAPSIRVSINPKRPTSEAPVCLFDDDNDRPKTTLGSYCTKTKLTNSELQSIALMLFSTFRYMHEHMKSLPRAIDVDNVWVYAPTVRNTQGNTNEKKLQEKPRFKLSLSFLDDQVHIVDLHPTTTQKWTEKNESGQCWWEAPGKPRSSQHVAKVTHVCIQNLIFSIGSTLLLAWTGDQGLSYFLPTHKIKPHLDVSPQEYYTGYEKQNREIAQLIMDMLKSDQSWMGKTQFSMSEFETRWKNLDLNRTPTVPRPLPKAPEESSSCVIM